MERFCVTSAQGECPNPFRVERLPANGEFRLLRVVLRMLRAQNCSRRCIMAVPLFALGNVELEAVCPWQAPCRAGHWKSHFLIGCPYIAVYLRRFKMRGADAARRCVKRIGIVSPSLATVFK